MPLTVGIMENGKMTTPIIQVPGKPFKHDGNGRVEEKERKKKLKAKRLSLIQTPFASLAVPFVCSITRYMQLSGCEGTNYVVATIGIAEASVGGIEVAGLSEGGDVTALGS